MKDPVLVAFEVSPNSYNVWRYDTPSTTRILFCHKALSKDYAVSDAVEIIRKNET